MTRQMNAVLKDDFEKKMTVVGLLKQYAEHRDVDTFARGLSVVLASDSHESLLQYIRLALDTTYSIIVLRSDPCHVSYEYYNSLTVIGVTESCAGYR